MTKYNFEFATREGYLSYRADWRQRYQRASQEVRSLKAQLVEAYREGRSSRASSLQSDLHFARRAANDLMIEITEAKKHKNQIMAAMSAVAA